MNFSAYKHFYLYLRIILNQFLLSSLKMMYVVSFHPIFNENAMVLSKRLGVPFIVDLTPKNDDIIVVFGAHEQADKLYLVQQNFKISYIIIQTEQFESKVFDNKYFMELIQANPILDWSRLNVERIKSKINTKVYSLYYYDFFGLDNMPDFDNRPIDFFFSGAKNSERESMINEFKMSNPDSIFEIDYSYSYTNPVELTKKLMNVKYVINIPFYGNNALETHRINRALSLGCEVISLPSADLNMNSKYDPYVHFVKRLNDFTPLLEIEPRSNYKKLLDDFGKREIENNVKAIFYAQKKILESRETTVLENKVIETNDVVKPLRQPVSTDFSKFLAKKKLNENKNSNDELKNVDSSV
jgi:hypothetical protein